MSARCPQTAAAATIAGDIRCVRAPRPCRPSKFRLVDEATRSPSMAISSFIAKHIEQPASGRHSNPAVSKMVRRPSDSAFRRVIAEPGTTIASTPSATCRPSNILAASRRSSIRLLVHEPIKAVSILIDWAACPSVRPIYCNARCSAALAL